MSMSTRILFALVVLLATTLVRADEWDRYHPDQYHRTLGFEAWERGERALALKHFQEAARFADKPSQLALAFAHWDTPGQRALAYAWADVAAERGYPDFLAVRERYWSALDAAEQAEAKRLGESIAAEYGDAKAKKRLEGRLRQGLSRKTGSRTGSGVSAVATGSVGASGRATMIAALSTSALNNIVVEDPDRGITAAEASGIQATQQLSLLSAIAGEVTRRHGVNYYGDANWKPKAYWAYQDSMWMELDGVVEVKALRRRPRALEE